MSSGEPRPETGSGVLPSALLARRSLVLTPSSLPGMNAWLGLLAAASQWHDVWQWATRRQAASPDMEGVRVQAIALMHLGAVASALRGLRMTLGLNPNHAENWAYMGEGLSRLGLHELAAAALGRALHMAPAREGIHDAFMISLVAAGRQGDVLRLISSLRGPSERRVFLGTALATACASAGCARETEAALHLAAAAAPDHPDAPAWLAEAAGLAFGRSQTDAVVVALRKIAVIAPSDAEAFSNLSEMARNHDEKRAMVQARRSVVIDPMLAIAWGNLALAYQALAWFADVESCLRKSLAAAPAHLPTLVNLSQWLTLSDNAKEAERVARRAQALDPESPGIMMNLSFALLAQGKVREGYRLQEARLVVPGSRSTVKVRIDRPRWQREPLGGRSLLIWKEQGVGDHFFFARYLAMLPPLDGRVLLECDPRLLPLFQRSFPDFVALAGRTTIEETLGGRDVDLQIPISSLPLLLITETEAAIAAAKAGKPWPAVQYLRADPAKVSRWRSLPAKYPDRPRIGISWRSGALTTMTRPHYLDPQTIADILRGVPVTTINVQYSWQQEEIDLLKRELDDFVNPPIDLRDDLDDVAAILAGCDLVLSPHTAAMYLAAALAVPTWSFMVGRNWSTHGLPGQPLLPLARHFPRLPTESWDHVIRDIHRALVERYGAT